SYTSVRQQRRGRKMKFGYGLTRDLPAARDSKCPHNRSDDDIGPAAAGPKYPYRSGNDGKIADGIIAGAYPDGAHVGVSPAEAKQHGGDPHVCKESKDSHRAHDLRCWESTEIRMKARDADDPQGECE